MDPFPRTRPTPTKRGKQATFVDGYAVIPENAGPGPNGYDGNLRAPHSLSKATAYPDADCHDSPGYQGSQYPGHLVYRRKDGQQYTLPPKLQSKSVPEMRILPQSVLYANKCLRYYGYFMERLAGGDSEMQEYGYRVRRIVLTYYLEDDTMTVFEPPLENFGVVQGTVCPRGRYLLGRDCSLEQPHYYHYSDLKLGRDYQIAHHVIRLFDADEYTKTFWLEHLPLDSIGSPEEPLSDPVWMHQQAKRIVFNSSGEKIQQKKSDVVEPNPKVYHLTIPEEDKLQFVGILDDTNTCAPRCRPVVVEYFFVDETVKVTEYRIENDAHSFGRVVNTVVHRGRIPRTKDSQAKQFGLGPIHKPIPTEFYGPSDFVIGNTLWLYGRKILLVECTEWTRKWHMDNGTTMQPNLSWKDQFERRRMKTKPEVVIPTHCGIGTHEDSLRSCFELDPQVRVANEVSWLCNSEDVIVYHAKMISRHPDADIPGYSVLYYLADDTISVLEHAVPGDESYGKVFLSRRRCPIGDQVKEYIQHEPHPPPYYDYRHLLPGNILHLYGNQFLLTSAAESIVKVLEKHPLYSDDEKRMILDSVESGTVDFKGSEPAELTEDELINRADKRARNLAKWLKYGVLKNAKFLMYLFSAGDQGPYCPVTEELLRHVCQEAKLDWDLYSGAKLLAKIRTTCRLDQDEPLMLEDFLKFICRLKCDIKECEEISNPKPDLAKLKFRLDLHI